MEWVYPGGGYPPDMGPHGWVHTHRPSQIWDTTGYGQQAGSTHLSGMLSCFSCDFVSSRSHHISKSVIVVSSFLTSTSMLNISKHIG